MALEVAPLPVSGFPRCRRGGVCVCVQSGVSDVSGAGSSPGGGEGSRHGHATP